jgi:hypothetical protein
MLTDPHPNLTRLMPDEDRFLVWSRLNFGL